VVVVCGVEEGEEEEEEDACSDRVYSLSDGCRVSIPSILLEGAHLLALSTAEK
jgi:hypothetical protein